MLNQLFTGVFEGTNGMGIAQFLACLLVSLLIGAFLAWVYNRKNESSQSFSVTLALLPAIVCVVIMMVNGNVGAGVAVAGAFSLVRFRSVPGSAKEIGMLFLAMGTGLITGMGYLAYGVLFALLLSGAMVLFSTMKFGTKRKPATRKTVKITIPEDLNYNEVFDEVFEKYAKEYEVVSVKTTNMGSLFKLTCHVDLLDVTKEKEMIDELRCRNGNLEISVMRQEENVYEL